MNYSTPKHPQEESEATIKKKITDLFILCYPDAPLAGGEHFDWHIIASIRDDPGVIEDQIVLIPKDPRRQADAEMAFPGPRLLAQAALNLKNVRSRLGIKSSQDKFRITMPQLRDPKSPIGLPNEQIWQPEVPNQKRNVEKYVMARTPSTVLGAFDSPSSSTRRSTPETPDALRGLGSIKPEDSHSDPPTPQGDVRLMPPPPLPKHYGEEEKQGPIGGTPHKRPKIQKASPLDQSNVEAGVLVAYASSKTAIGVFYPYVGLRTKRVNKGAVTNFEGTHQARINKNPLIKKGPISGIPVLFDANKQTYECYNDLSRGAFVDEQEQVRHLSEHVFAAGRPTPLDMPTTAQPAMGGESFLGFPPLPPSRPYDDTMQQPWEPSTRHFKVTATPQI